jgi:cupin fold WbuC family metalloprotein
MIILLYNMDIQLLDKKLLAALHEKAMDSPRLRMNFDLRTTPEDTSQRMLNALEPGTKVAIHRHLDTSETAVCLEGCLDWVFYQELPNMDAGGPVHDGTTVVDETQFVECGRFRICPREGVYGIQIPQGAWHNIEVYEPSTIFEAKDGKFLR